RGNEWAEAGRKGRFEDASESTLGVQGVGESSEGFALRVLGYQEAGAFRGPCEHPVGCVVDGALGVGYDKGIPCAEIRFPGMDHIHIHHDFPDSTPAIVSTTSC